MVSTLIRKNSWIPEELEWQLKQFNPRSELGKIIKSCFGFLPPEAAAELLEAISRCVVLESSLSVVVTRANGKVEDYGVMGRKVITTAGVNFLVDAWQNSVELEIMKYHGIGTGGTAEAVGDTALVAECTTALLPDNTRATGTLTEGSGANVLQTVGTLTLDATTAVLEHGLFSQAATGGGTLWDRTLYSAAVGLVSGDGITNTYNMTASAGG